MNRTFFPQTAPLQLLWDIVDPCYDPSTTRPLIDFLCHSDRCHPHCDLRFRGVNESRPTGSTVIPSVITPDLEFCDWLVALGENCCVHDFGGCGQWFSPLFNAFILSLWQQVSACGSFLWTFGAIFSSRIICRCSQKKWIGPKRCIMSAKLIFSAKAMMSSPLIWSTTLDFVP